MNKNSPYYFVFGNSIANYGIFPNRQRLQQSAPVLKSDGAFENGLWKYSPSWTTAFRDSAQGSALVGKAIGGLGALMYLGYMGWQMAAGDREWKLPHAKTNSDWIYTCLLVRICQSHSSPFWSHCSTRNCHLSATSNLKSMIWGSEIQKATATIRCCYQTQCGRRCKQEVINNTSQNADDSWFDVSEGLDKLIQPIKEWRIRNAVQMQKLVAEVIEFVCLSILRICVYLIFSFKKNLGIYSIILGPIAVGMALVPGFENSLYSWVSKFININLYTFVAYTIINIGQQLIASGYTMEIERYDALYLMEPLPI